MSVYGEWCPKCAAEIVSVTRGIPSMGTCKNGHTTDRRDTLRREPVPVADLSQAAVAAALEAAAVKASLTFEREYASREELRAQDIIVDRIRALITSAQHDALAAHVTAARAEWVGSHCKELTAADRAYITAHLSYELEPVGKPPTWNQLAMEVVRLSNALAQIGAKP